MFLSLLSGYPWFLLRNVDMSLKPRSVPSCRYGFLFYPVNRCKLMNQQSRIDPVQVYHVWPKKSNNRKLFNILSNPHQHLIKIYQNAMNFDRIISSFNKNIQQEASKSSQSHPLVPVLGIRISKPFKSRKQRRTFSRFWEAKACCFCSSLGAPWGPRVGCGRAPWLEVVYTVTYINGVSWFP